MILLDTNVLSELMKVSPNPRVIGVLDQTPAEFSFISSVTHAEILQGVALLDDGKRKEKIANTAKIVLDLFEKRTLSFDLFSSPFYADVIKQRTKKGRPIDFPDAQIAAIALQHHLQLVTRNSKDFEGIEPLKLLNPWL